MALLKLKNVSVASTPKELLTKKIEKRFMGKQTGRMILKLNKGVKLAIEYMYGNKYSLKRKEGSRVVTIILIGNVDDVAKEIMREKTRTLFNK